jgi:hypothetical protein
MYLLLPKDEGLLKPEDCMVIKFKD